MNSNPILDVKNELNELLMCALGEAVAANELAAVPLPAFSTEIPADVKNGDFAANIAMVSAKALGMPPRKIAEIIVAHLPLDGSNFDRAEIAGPGFINIFLGHSWFEAVLAHIEADAENYGKTNYGNHQKYMVEFVSANPTGPMHIGNARGGAIGDTLAEVLSWSGHDVTREFYVNDAGNQIERFATSLARRYLQIYKENIEFPEDAYKGEDIKVLAQEFADIHGDSFVDAPEDDIRKAMVEYGLPKNLATLKSDLSRYRINYDIWFKESTLHESNEVMRCVDILLKNDKAYRQDGTVFYRTGGEKDEVLVRENGIPTYFAADIAYHYNKFAVRGFDKVINIWGADHHGHVARLKGSMDAIGLSGDKLDIVLMQLVRLVRGGETIRVSKRTGKSITLADLLEEVPIDAARFFFNLREANSHFDFDLDLAVSESSQNPVYYVQYAHARIRSIVQNLAAEGVKLGTCQDCDLTLLTAPEELALIRHLGVFPNEIICAAKTYDPARMTKYAIDLATLFHKFYTACRVKQDDLPLMQARLVLCATTKIVIANVLALLKIDAPSVM